MMQTWSRSAGNLLIWFAGFLDADGTIGIHRQTTRTGTTTWVPELSVTSTCSITADHIHQIFKQMNLPIYRLDRKSTKSNWSDRYHLEVRGMLRVEKVLPLLQPFLVTKAEEAALTMAFIASRRLSTRGRDYTPEELAMVARIAEIKRSRHK